MVNKVTVNPLEVRGAGDIVSPKTASDFDVFNSAIVSSSEDVGGATMTVYTVSYVSGTYFTVSSESIVPVGEASFTVSAVLKKNSDDSAVSGASVSCTVNGETVLTGTTDSNGSVSFTIPTMEDVSKYTVKLVYSGTENVGGAFKVTGLICVDLTTLALALTGNKTIIQTNDSCVLIATLTGVGVDGERIGVPGQTVTVYEEYTPALDITATPQIIQSGDNTSIILQLKDEEDGSLVRESGLTIDLYSNVTVFKSFTLTSDKDVLSYYDEESAVLTATYLEDNVGVSGKSVVFRNGDTVLDTVVTDSNGEAEYTYASSGVGDVTITAECMNLQETCSIEDCLYYNDGTNLSSVTVGSGVSCTVSDGALRITKSTSGEAYVTIPQTFTNSDNFVVEWKVACTGANQRTAFWLHNATTANGLWCCYESGHFTGAILGTSIPVTTTSLDVGDKIYLKQENGVITILKNNSETITSKSTSFSSSTYNFGYYTNNERVQCVDNIKIKPL